MYIFASAEENNAALVSGKVTRRFPLIFSGATFPIRLLLVKWRDEPLKMLSFLGDPKGNPKKLNISGRSPPQNQQKSNGKCQTRKCELETKQSFEADQSRVILWRRRRNYAFLANNAEIHKSPKTHFFIEKMLEILRCRMANVWK